MPKFSAERIGERVKVKGRELSYSFWPSRLKERRYALQSKLFVSSPWNIIERKINSNCPKPAKVAALAYFSQAKEFYDASQSRGNNSAKPLLIYYSFMNLLKAILLTNRSVLSFGDVYHGLTTNFPKNITPIPQGTITAKPNTARNINLFDLMLTNLFDSGIGQRDMKFQLSRVFSQILLGHRLWCQSADHDERFISIKTPEFIYNSNHNECWLSFEIPKSDLSRLDVSARKTLKMSGLEPHWRLVTPQNGEEGIIKFETINTNPCNRVIDIANDLAKETKHLFWHSITTTPPFRKYYIYLKRPREIILPQFASIYCAFFYLGSITRYRPHMFEKLISGPYGDFIQEFIENQPSQWLYMLASELATQEVTHAAVV